MIRRPPRSTLSSSSAASDVYKRQAELSHDRLQGHAECLAAPHVLPGHRGPAFLERDRDGPLALLHEHVPVVGTRPPVPLHLPQRRDQHPPPQRQLDPRPPVAVSYTHLTLPTKRIV